MAKTKQQAAAREVEAKQWRDAELKTMPNSLPSGLASTNRASMLLTAPASSR